MKHISSNAITACLILGGVVVWGVVAPQVARNVDLKIPVNPFGINRSPYGEVIAMAMQGPIDSYFHGGETHEHGEHCDHDHDHGDHHGDHHDHEETTQLAQSASLPVKLGNFIDELTKAAAARTNTQPISNGHKFYLRRQIENKLRFAYNLDPSHYGNYNSYHLFLTESELATRPVLTAGAAKLAQETISYCLKQQGDPRPALTAASAAQNMLDLMITDFKSENPHFSIDHLEQALAVVDHSLATYHQTASEWQATGQWKRLSAFRIQETEDRLYFITKLRDFEHAVIEQFKKKTTALTRPSQVSTESTPGNN
jgi:hypothetical protein